MHFDVRLHVIVVVTILDVVDCVWEDWGPWQTCTVTCGDGKILRNRGVNTEARFGGKNCTGNNTDEQDCKNDQCLGR